MRLRTTTPGPRYRCPRTARAWRLALTGTTARAPSPGTRRVYAESGGTWTQVGSDIDGEAILDLSGCSVSMSSDGTRVAIGAHGNSGTGTFAGHVRVYAESGGTWTQVGSDIDGEAAGDYSGYSVSMSSDGTRVAIGAYGNTGNGIAAGHVRVYRNLCTDDNLCTLLRTRAKTARTAAFTASTAARSAGPPGHARARPAIRATEE